MRFVCTHITGSICIYTTLNILDLTSDFLLLHISNLRSKHFHKHIFYFGQDHFCVYKVHMVSRTKCHYCLYKNLYPPTPPPPALISAHTYFYLLRNKHRFNRKQSHRTYTNTTTINIHIFDVEAYRFVFLNYTYNLS